MIYIELIIHCCAHIMNLAVSATISSNISSHALKRVKSIVSKLNKSGKMKKAFKRFLLEEFLPCVIPMNDSPTRWSSTYFMLCDFLNAMPAVEKLMSSFNLNPLEDGELRILKAMRSFLQPYQAMTSQVILLLNDHSNRQIAHCTNRGESNNTRREALQFGEKLLDKTKEYFAKCFLNQPLRFAALCDPRFAFLDTVLTKDEWKETVDRFLMAKMSLFSSIESDDDITERPCTPKGTNMWSLLTTQSPNDPPSRSSQQEEDLQMELQQYAIQLNRGDARPNPDSDPIAWWRSHQNQFPLLASSASEYLVAPCTSVDSERLFRTCKSWTQREVLRYGCPQESSGSSASEETYSEDGEESAPEEEEDFHVMDG